jgi:glycine/D-amino acid oxidase-like deaminating enzyme
MTRGGNDGAIVDLVIIGGGITGLGIARAACLSERRSRGRSSGPWSVHLFERGRLASEASSNSHCIIHSGLRYMQNGAVGRILESARSLAELRRAFPEQIAPLPCWMPVFGWGTKGRCGLTLGHLGYRAIVGAGRVNVSAGPGVVPIHKSPEHPLVKRRGAIAAFGWEDGWLRDHHGLVGRVREQIESAGGVVREQTSVERMNRENGRFIVELSGGEVVHCRVVVDARGPWGDEESGNNQEIRWCVGYNVVLGRDISSGLGIAVPITGDGSNRGRMLFISPRSGGRSAIGTGYLPLSACGWREDRSSIGSVSGGTTLFSEWLATRSSATVPEEHLASLVDEVAGAGVLGLSLNDVVGVESGILPRQFVRLREGPSACAPVAADPRTHIAACDGHITVQAGKYTTFPSVGARVVALGEHWLSKERCDA